MPYIKQEKRTELLQGYCFAENPGELNFVLTLLCLEYFNNKGKSYQTYNDIIGALECCKLEMYRRSVAPYEELKIAENGDLYT